MDPVAAARDYVRDEHPAASAAFLAGSTVTPLRTATSDLDIVLFLPGPPAPFRETLIRSGRPLEVFAHTVESWWDYVDRETARRRSPLLAMCAEGVLLFDDTGTGAEITAQARLRYEAGPPAATADELEDARYVLTCLIDDIDGGTAPHELGFVVADLVRRAAETALLTARHWQGTGKWLARRLAAADPAIARRLTAGHAGALNGRTEPLRDTCVEILERAGGPLRSGYRRAGRVPDRRS